MTTVPTLTDAMTSSTSAVGLLSVAPIASMVLDEAGSIVWLNDAARMLFDLELDLLGTSATEVDGAVTGSHHLSDLFVAVEREPILAQVRYVVNPDLTGRTRFAATLRRHDRRTTPVDVHLVTLGDGTVLAQAVDPPPMLERTALEHQRAFCDAIVSLSALAQEEHEGDDFYRVLLRQVIDVVPGAQAGTILIRTPDTDDFSFVASEGFDLEALQAHRMSASELHCELTTGSATIVRTIDNSSMSMVKQEWIRAVGRTDEIRSSVSAPVLVNGEAVAFLNANNFDSDEAFDTMSLEMTTVFGRLVSDLISRRRLERDLRQQGESYKHLANHDPLTGLPNRRHIEESMMEIAGSSVGASQPMALLFADLDDFKTVNDTHGHEAGDLLLQATAERMTAATRGPDVVGRWGGDEFVVVAPDVACEAHARQLGERILARCTGETLELPGGRSVPISMSIGIAWTDRASGGVWALLRRADDAVYRAKLQGKGVVCVNAS